MQAATVNGAPSRMRVQRSQLAVPATGTHLFAKAANSAADCVFIDLEDAVAPAAKDDARRNAISALNTVDWRSKTMSVRVNALDSRWGLRDILEIAGNCPRLDLIMLPRVGTAFDVQFVATLLGALEREQGAPKRIGIEAIVETPLGVVNLEQIAAASDRLEALIFGVGDYSIDMQSYDSVIGTAPAGGDPWDATRVRLANACRAFGLRPIDGPYTKYTDADGLRASAARAAQLGFEGKWSIHPSQIAVCNEAFTPTFAHIDWARRTLELMQKAAATGTGAVGANGAVVDMAHVRLARAILQRAAKFWLED